MRYLTFAIALTLLPAGAYAESELSMNSTTFFIGNEVCQWAAKNTPDDDVAYQPGVDVDGNAVAPAAADAPSYVNDQLMRQISIDLTGDLALQLGIPNDLIRQRLNVGTVEIDEDGQPTINGEPLNDPDPASWQAACDQAKKP